MIAISHSRQHEGGHARESKHHSIASPTDMPGSQHHGPISDAEAERIKRHRKELIWFWASFILSIVFGVGVSYGVLGPVYLTPAFEKTLPAGYGEGIYLLGVVETLDLDGRALSIQWLVYSCEETGPYSGCNALTEAVNFFIDGNASPASSLDPLTAVAMYQANLTGYITDGFCVGETSCWQEQLAMGVPYEQTLQTSHQFSIRPAAYNWRSNSQAYPFDVYTVYTTFLAIDPTVNASKPILGLSLTGTVPNFSVTMHSRPVTNSAYPSFERRMVTVTIARAQIVVAYAFLIWLINWLMTGVVLWITISAVQGRRKIPGDLFGIPITALFALPAVRSIMPGSPAFGCILDYSGIILNLLVLAVCSVALLLCVIDRDGKELYTPVHHHKVLHPAANEAEAGRRSVFGVFKRSKSAASGMSGLGLSELVSQPVVGGVLRQASGSSEKDKLHDEKAGMV